MIKTRTVTKLETTISIEKREAVKNFASCFLDHIQNVINQDYKSENFFSEVRTEIASLLNDFNDIEFKGFRPLFEKGFTPMILDEPSMEYVDRYFSEKDKHSHNSLQIWILDDGEIIEKIKENSIQY